jgi:hypothetical protein
MNDHYLADYKSKFLAHYKGARESCQQPDLMKTIQSFPSSQAQALAQATRQGYVSQPTGIAKVIASLAELGLSGVRAEDLAKLLPSDKMEPALEIMAGVRAYFQGMLLFRIFIL